MDHLPQQGTFFSEKHQFKFHVPFGPFYSAKLQKKFLEWIQSYDNMPFSGKNGPLAPNDFFFSGKPLIQVPCTSWSLSLYKISKKSLEWI